MWIDGMIVKSMFSIYDIYDGIEEYVVGSDGGAPTVPLYWANLGFDVTK